MVHDRDPVAELVRLLHVVRGEEDGLSLGVQLVEDLPQRDAALRVETGGGLVEEEDGGSVHHRARDHQPLRHAPRQLEHLRRGAIGEPELLEQAGRFRLRVPGAHPEEASVEVEVLLHAERPVERVRLGNDPDRLLRQRRVRDHVDAAHDGAAFGRDHHRGEHPDGGRLAGAVRTQQAEDLAAAQRQVEIVDGLHAAGEDLGEALGADDLFLVLVLNRVGSHADKLGRPRRRLRTRGTGPRHRQRDRLRLPRGGAGGRAAGAVPPRIPRPRPDVRGAPRRPGRGGLPRGGAVDARLPPHRPRARRQLPGGVPGARRHRARRRVGGRRAGGAGRSRLGRDGGLHRRRPRTATVRSPRRHGRAARRRAAVSTSSTPRS